MPYIDYNLSLYRTGFRPYGLTNPWGAAQQTVVSVPQAAMSGYLGRLGQPNAQWPMHEAGGFRMRTGAHRVHSYLQGLGQGGAPAVCLDQNQNTISCADPECTYGDCGSTGPQVTVGSLCLDQQQNQIACTDPNCTFGDCTAPGKKPTPLPPGGGVYPPPGPSPRTYLPPTLFPQTAPLAPYPYAASSTAQIMQQITPMLPILIIGLLLLGSGKR